jgi:hypothetical protein
MIITAIHTDGHRVLFDTEEGVYYDLPEITGKICVDGRFFDHFDTIDEMIAGDKNTAIIPVFCSEKRQVKKREQVTILSGQTSRQFLSAEMICGKWTRNEIEIMEKGKAYFVFFEKNKYSDNLVLIKKIKEIVK